MQMHMHTRTTGETTIALLVLPTGELKMSNKPTLCSLELVLEISHAIPALSWVVGCRDYKSMVT